MFPRMRVNRPVEALSQWEAASIQTLFNFCSGAVTVRYPQDISGWPEGRTERSGVPPRRAAQTRGPDRFGQEEHRRRLSGP